MKETVAELIETFEYIMTVNSLLGFLVKYSQGEEPKKLVQEAFDLIFPSSVSFDFQFEILS